MLVIARSITFCQHSSYHESIVQSCIIAYVAQSFPMSIVPLLPMIIDSKNVNEPHLNLYDKTYIVSTSSVVWEP